MSQNQNRKDAIRSYAAERGISYTAALRHFDSEPAPAPVAEVGPWARVEAALPKARGMYFDGCHKIYIAMDDAENAKFLNGDWPQTSDPDLGVLHKWFDKSCKLRLSSAVSTNLEDPNAGFDHLIAQFEVLDDDDDEDGEQDGIDDDEFERSLTERVPKPPVYTVSWENGEQVVDGIVVESRSAAFAKLDSLFRGAEYPDSIRVVLHENGTVFWSQLGSFIEFSE